MLYWKELSNNRTVGYTDKGLIKYIISRQYNDYFLLKNISGQAVKALAYIDKHYAIKAAEALENST